LESQKLLGNQVEVSFSWTIDVPGNLTHRYSHLARTPSSANSSHGSSLPLSCHAQPLVETMEFLQKLVTLLTLCDEVIDVSSVIQNFSTQAGNVFQLITIVEVI